MNRNALIGLSALIVLAGGLALYFAFTPVPAQAPADDASPVANPYVEQEERYAIAANYPTSTPALAGEGAVTAIQGWVISRVSEFKENDFSTLPEGTKASLTIRYLISSSVRSVSYIFTVDEYAGGAHGMTDFTTFTFDTAEGGELALADIFEEGAPYLDRLSELSRAKLAVNLREYADESAIAAGTEPNAGNFSRFFLDNATLVILFPPYQVAAYAAGPQTVQIPLAEIADILKSEYEQ